MTKGADTKPKSKRSRLRRWLFRLVLGGLLFVLLLVGILTVVLKTDAGRGFVRDRVVTTVNGAINGTIEIDSLDVGLNGRVELFGVRLHDQTGEMVLALDHAIADLAVIDTIRGNLRLTELQLEVGTVLVDKLASLAKPKEEEDDSPPPEFLVDRIWVRGGPVMVGPAEIDSIELIGMASHKEQHMHAALSWLSARVTIWLKDRPIPAADRAGNALSAMVSASQLTLLDDQIAALGLSVLPIGSPGTGIKLNMATFAIDRKEVGALGRIWVNPEEARKLAAAADVVFDPERNLKASIDTELAVSGKLDGAWHARISGLIAGALSEITADAVLEPLSANARIYMAGLDPSAAWKTAPPGKLDLAISATGRMPKKGEMHAALGVAGKGTLLGVTTHLALVGVGASQVGDTQTVNAHVALASNRGVGSVLAGVRKRGESVQVDRLLVRGRDLPLPAQIKTKKGIVSLGGTVRGVQVSAQGKLERLVVNAQAEVDNARVNDIRVDALDLHHAGATLDVPALVATKKLPSAGSFNVDVTGLSIEGKPFGNHHAEGEIRERGAAITVSTRHTNLGGIWPPLRSARTNLDVRMSGGEAKTISVLARKLDVVTGELTWSGGGKLTRYASGGIRADKFHIESRAAALTADGEFSSPRRRARRGDAENAPVLKVTLSRVDIAQLKPFVKDNLPPQIAELTGMVRADLALSRSGNAPTLKGEIGIDNAIWKPGTPRLAATIGIDVASRAASVKLRASAEKIATVEADVAVAAPADPLDAAGWKRLGPRDLLASKVLVKDADLQGINAFLPEEKRHPVRGRVTAGVEVEAGAKRLAFHVDLNDAGVEKWSGVAARALGTWDERGVRADLAIDFAKQPLLTAGFSQKVALPSLIDGTVDFKTAPFEAGASIEKFDLLRLHQAGLSPEPVAGQLDLELAVNGTLMDPKFEIKRGLASDVAVRNVPQKYKIELGGKGDRRAVSVSLAASQGSGFIKLDSSVQLEPTVKLKKAVFKAESFDLKLIGSFFQDPHPLANAQGQLFADFTVESGQTRPAIKGRLRVEKGKIQVAGGLYRFSDIDLSLLYDTDTVLVEKLMAKVGDGEVVAAGKVKLGPSLLPDEVLLKLRTERFQLLQKNQRILIDAEVTLSGGPKDGRFDGALAITDAEVRLSESGEELQSLDDLEDVVYVDKEAVEELARAGSPAPFPPVNIKINTESPLRVEVDLPSTRVKASIKVDIELALKLRNLKPTMMTGSVKVARGNAVLIDREYNFSQGLITFDKKIGDPKLELMLTRDFPQASVTIFVGGRVSRPILRLTDDAGHDETQVLAIMTGQDPDDPDARAQGGEVSGLAGLLVATELKKRLSIPIDVIRPSPQGVELGKWILRNRVLVLYKYRAQNSQDGTSNRNEGAVEWPILRQLLFEASYGDEQEGAADLLWIFRF